MGPKILWVLLPLAAYAALLALAWRGKAPSRLAVNIHSSLLLMAYLLATAGLGLFWVANQQLPVFDWHYLFGYATLLLVSLHLFFNLPTAWRWLRQRRVAAAPAPKPAPAGSGVAWRGVARLAGAAGALVLAFALGAHWGSRGIQSAPDASHASHASASAGGAASAAIATVLRYHAASSSSRSGVLLRAPAVDWGSQPGPFKVYPTAPHIALPRAVADHAGVRSLAAMLRGSAPAVPMRALDLAAVGQLLHLTAGVTARRGGVALRAAPSSGALFPAELYLLVRRVDGVQPGLYHFDPDRHRLAWLGALPAGLPAIDADLLMVVSAVFQRTGYKYRDRAYRYVAADLGHLLENARLAGHYVHARVALLEQFDEAALEALFDLDGSQEGVIAAAAFSAGPAPPPAVPIIRPRSAESAASARVAALGITGQVHTATSLAGLQASGSGGTTLDSAGRSEEGLVSLPAGDAAEADLARTILQRRSQRRFSDQPVELQQLASILADMAQAPLLSGALHADLVVNRVTGLKPGVYRYRPARHALQPVQLGDFAAQARSAALDQDVIGDAAVVLILSTDSAKALGSGARGYRMAFLEAGLMGERWLLAAVARGLGACPVGAFYDEEAAALVNAQKGRWVLHFAALGRAQD
ncbi:SagB-type dehydrogenase domain-containing protein [Duganella sp. CF458]|uniref:SagB/ThcOx family dehydrogenase n=1 Tax=Duganella sp. CF458 TaxID=1884368 RepID=UPI0008E50B33|nr:SagB family peptide dehydrogenase [Duganella sp. CF458]SFF83660.1 SagB-type dehydrogenase domain-containing protein [Duganella sp. CF458]